MSRSHLALGLLFLAASTGLLAAEQEQPIGGEAGQSIDQIDSASGVQSEAFDTSELWAMTFTNTVLTIDLLRSLPPNENVFFSPMGVSELLSMALEGAGGETRNRMLEFLEKRWAKQGVNLKAGLDPVQLGRMMHRAVEDLAGSDSLAFKVGNSIWSLPPLKPGFSQTVERSFNTDLVEVDPTFPAMKPEILEWISRQTNGKGVFPSELLAEPLLRILMINTLYLNARWESPFSVDATRCLSYTTIEHRGTIDRSLHRATGDWLFGCDVCQEVCPHNQPTRRTKRLPVLDAYAPRRDGFDLLDVLNWAETDRREAFITSSMKRAKLEMFRRNAVICAGNALVTRDEPELFGRLQEIARDPDESELVRRTACEVLEDLEQSKPA